MLLSMRAMVLRNPKTPLELVDLPIPEPGPGQVQIEVAACAVCRTDLHVVDGDLTKPKLPLVPGHEIVGRVTAVGPGVDQDLLGKRVGVPWLGYSCGTCRYCKSGRENLCDSARFTGYDIDGGYAEYTVADHRYCFPIPDGYPDVAAAPLLCAGLIGYRSFAMARENPDLAHPGGRLGIYGFGAAAHIVAQVARHHGLRVFAVTRPGDRQAQEFARSLGAEWAGGADEQMPDLLDAAIIFAPAGELVPQALRALAKGGTLVCGGIHMSDIPGFPYEILWGERSIRSVANLTRRDGLEFLTLAPEIPVQTKVQLYPLEQANEALEDLRAGRLQGAAVLTMKSPVGERS